MRLISSEYLDGHTIPGKLIFNYFGNSMNANFRVERDKLYLIVKGASWGTTFILSSAPDTSTKEMGGVYTYCQPWKNLLWMEKQSQISREIFKSSSIPMAQGLGSLSGFISCSNVKGGDLNEPPYREILKTTLSTKADSSNRNNQYYRNSTYSSRGEKTSCLGNESSYGREYEGHLKTRLPLVAKARQCLHRLGKWEVSLYRDEANANIRIYKNTCLGLDGIKLAQIGGGY